MDLNPAETDLFASYLSSFTPLAGDRRTAALLGETVYCPEGARIIGSESLYCSRIAAFPPCARRQSAR